VCGNSERRVLGSAAELREALEGPLRVVLPEAMELDAVLARLTAQARQAHSRTPAVS